MHTQQNSLFMQARASEKVYHEQLYRQKTLFSKGSWLAKPVQLVMDTFDQYFSDQKDVSILDLGSGVGRNAIPLAQRLEHTRAVTCVDILDVAIDQLRAYAKQYAVMDRIIPVRTAVEDFLIAQNTYDYMVSISCIEHVETKEILKRILQHMITGTKAGGVHCLMIQSDICWIDVENGMSLTPVVELNMQTEDLLALLRTCYEGWNIKTCSIKQWKVPMMYEEKNIILESDCVSFVAQKKKRL